MGGNDEDPEDGNEEREGGNAEERRGETPRRGEREAMRRGEHEAMRSRGYNDEERVSGTTTGKQTHHRAAAQPNARRMGATQTQHEEEGEGYITRRRTGHAA